MSNSSLVDYKILSPNHSGRRTHSIDRITPHCVVGQLTAQGIAGCFPKGRGASCNYGIGRNGDVALIVDESNRSWCSSSNSNDQRAITIECASDKVHPYTMNSKVYSKLIELCVDICKRNGKNKLIWILDKATALSYVPKPNEMLITVHRWFANKSCPGDWLFNRLGDLADEVTKKLKSSDEPVQKTLIMGESECSAAQLKEFLLSKNPSPKLNVDINTFCNYWIEEGKIEGVRGDIAFCQACHETGYFNYGGLVVPSQNNFGGIGATNNSKVGKGAWFDTSQLGVRANIQHLKAYASQEPLKQICIDPRYDLVKPHGKAPYFEDLGGKWAYPGYDTKKYNSLEEALRNHDTYGHMILKIYDKLKKVKVEEPTPTPKPQTKEITVEEAKEIIKEKLNFNDNTIQHIWNYRWGDEALIRIARGIK